MNAQTSLMTQPITAADLSALSSTLDAPGAVAAQATMAYLKMLVQMVQAPPGVAPTANQIFNALAAGAINSADSALYEALALETKIGGAVTALVIQAAGVVQVFEWAVSATEWFVGKLSAIGTLLYDVATLNVTDAIKQFLIILGISSSSPAKDSTNAINGLTMMLASQAPVLATAVAFLKNRSGGTSVASSGSNSTSSSASSSASSPVNGASMSASADATYNRKNSRKRKGRTQKDNLGINTRRKLIRTNIAH
jgi:hypothetical protein